MRCRTCDYPLWNLTTRKCPECGGAFNPADFDFVPGSVRFCCPGCRQAYYGTGPNGHLVPAAFVCVTCGRSLRMDDMVLLPADGVDERRTVADVNPWLERDKRGLLKAWLATVGFGLVMPQRLVRNLPGNSSLAAAWGFAVAALAVFLASGLLSLFLSIALLVSRTGGGSMAGALGGGGVTYVIALAVVLLLVVLWGLVTHAMLKVTGGCRLTLRRTYEALCYTAGASAAMAVPCIGVYPMGFIGATWWVVCAVLAVAAGHRVHGGRAALAVISLPASIIVLAVGSYLVFVYMVLTSAGPFGAMSGRPGSMRQETQIVLDAVLAYAAEHQGAGPAHAAQLVTSGDLTEWDLVTWDTATDVTHVRVGGVTLADLTVLDDDERAQAAAAAVQSLPGDVVAHRAGDFVFTHHGIDLAEAPGGLWLVIWWPDPSTNGTLATVRPAFVGLADGTVQAIPREQFAPALDAQNRLRAGCGLPPIPDPMTVTHRAPASAPDQVEP